MYDCVVITDYRKPFIHEISSTSRVFDVDYRLFEPSSNTHQEFHPLIIEVPDVSDSVDIDFNQSQPTSETFSTKTYLYASNYDVDRKDVINIIKDISPKPIS